VTLQQNGERSETDGRKFRFHTLLIAGDIATVRFFALKTFCFNLQPRILGVVALTPPGNQGL
jgi:hypothetical protein